MAIDVVTEEVARNLEEAAQTTRSINPSMTKYFVGGIVVGVAVGFYYGYRFTRDRIKAEEFKRSEEEIEKIREMYRTKAAAKTTPGPTPKPSTDQIVEEQGYSKKVTEQERPLRPPVPVNDPTVVFPRPHPDVSVTPTLPNWNWPEELQNRDPNFPYVIHQNEYGEKNKEGYSQTTYTYYALDDVLCDADDHPLPHADLIVGQDNLKFGHGTDDVDVVFVRNEKLELDMEICRINESYEEAVLGHDHSDAS